jgi:hypothetical protein
MLKSPLSKSLRAIAAALETLDQQELDALVAGKGKLVFLASEKPQEKGEALTGDAEAILERLNSCTDRDGARGVLSEIASKEALWSLATLQKIHVAKHDRREDIESKIIEFVIGGKLRSDAIQTLNLNGGGVPKNGSQ